MRGKEEANLIQKFKMEFLKRNPKAFWYKIPDYPGGPVRPFDAIVIACGSIFCLEFKAKTRILRHQQYYMDWAERNGAISMVIEPAIYEQTMDAICALIEKSKEEECLKTMN